MISMPNYLKNDVLLVLYPFTDLSGRKVRPAVVVHAPHPSQDVFVVPLTSQTRSPAPGEFVLTDWSSVGLNAPSMVKRGIYTLHPSLVVKQLKSLTPLDAQLLDQSLRTWLGH